MKKFVVTFISLFMLFIVGCSNVEKLNYTEYLSRQANAILNVSSLVEDAYDAVYASNYSDYQVEILEGKAIKNYLESYGKELSTFTCSDKEIALLHKDLIKYNSQCVAEVNKAIKLLENGNNNEAYEVIDNASIYFDNMAECHLQIFQCLESKGIDASDYLLQFGLDYLLY